MVYTQKVSISYYIKNAKRSTAYLFDIKNVSEFINFCVQIILNDLKDLRIYKV